MSPECAAPARAGRVYGFWSLNALVLLVGTLAAAVSVAIAPGLDRPVAAWAVSGVGLAAFLRCGPRAWLAGLEAAPAAKDAARGILVVEDNDDMRFITAQNLQRPGHAVREAATACEALRLLGQDAGIGLVLCDIGLPDIGGEQLAEEISRLYPGMKLILMSGGVPPSRTALKFLRKPFSREHLLRAVEDALTGQDAAPAAAAGSR